jgi:spore coat protein A
MCANPLFYFLLCFLFRCSAKGKGPFMSISRRFFLQQSSLLAGALITHQHQHVAVRAKPEIDLAALPKFVDALPIPTVIRSTATRPSPANSALQVPYYNVALSAFEAQVHRDMKPTLMWGYGGAFPGPTFDVQSGQEILVEWTNRLPEKHFLPIDHSLCGAGKDVPDVRAVVHLHGGRVPPDSDGYPESWTVPGKSAVYRYPNKQDAAALWYHDHAMGINRLNVYAGMAGMYLVRDAAEAALALPSGEFEIPLVLCDRMFDKDSQLYYPVSDNPDAPWTPELFGDAYLMNGKLLPHLDVWHCKYRFRLLNASNARFYRLALSNKQKFHVIGSDQGLLDASVAVAKFSIAPGERIDFIVDFSEHAGEEIVLMDDFQPVMQFRVANRAVVSLREPIGTPAADIRSAQFINLPSPLRPVQRTPESSAVKTRVLSLDEVDNLVQEPVRMELDAKRWTDPVTENPTLGSTEIWTLVNPTDDAHPIHLHLVRFQILDRRRFETSVWIGDRTLRFTGPVVPPEPLEAGWKDTVRADPGMVTRIIVKFDGYPGRYVWHCHILEHEDNEMMRPYDILPAPTVG